MTTAADIPTVTDAMPVRVRFCPSPTGTPHVGLIRTALFNWAYARHTGGKLIFRIEDTDAARDSEESYQQLLEAMTWLRIDWDEGVEVGGPHAPYRQSQRGELYRDVIDRLVAAGHLYESFSTPEEVEERHRAAGRDAKLGYDNHDRMLTEEQKNDFRRADRPAVLRLRMPDEDISFTDLVRGEITFRAGSVPDFAVVRATGTPLYTLVNPVDDALMGITHVLRGEDLLSSTPRQIALYRALIDIGVARYMPLFGHLPYVMGQGNKKLSKRDPESNLFLHRERGFIREGLLNYLSLLGWSLSSDEDIFSVEQFVDKFDVRDVLANPARFDLKKAEAINGTHVRLLDPAEFRSRLLPYLAAAGLIDADPTEQQLRIVAEAAPLIQERITLLGEAPEMLGFLFKDDDAVDLADDACKGLPDNLAEVLDATLDALESTESWDADSLQAALRGALVDALGLKPRLAFGPVRTAISGRRISPPLFESMVILGRDSSIARVRALRATVA